MSVLSAQSIRSVPDLVLPFNERSVIGGMSYGLSACGYDVRVKESITLPSAGFTLASTVERFKMPDNVMGVVHDKSTWARMGVQVQNTVIEPGWEGYLTLELSLATIHFRYPAEEYRRIFIPAGSPIAQIVFHWLDKPTELPYTGKYQNQAEGPQGARFE